MDNCINAVEQIRREVPDIAKMQPVQQHLGQPGRAGQVMGEVTAVETDQLGFRKTVPQLTDDRRSDIAHRAGNEYAHGGNDPIYHFFQGALPLDQRSSRYLLSRRVSIGCQNPSCMKTLN